MAQTNINPKEVLERAKLMMSYDSSKTLSENVAKVRVLKEDEIDTPTEKAIQKVLNACNQYNGVGTLDAAAIATAFNRAFNYQTIGMFGGTNDTLWKQQAAIMKKGNMDDLCNIKREFEDLGFGDFAVQLVEELDDEELAELMETFATTNFQDALKLKGNQATSATDQLNNVKTNILSTQAQIDRQNSEIENKSLQLEQKQKQVFGQSQEIEDKMRVLETRNKMLQLSIEKNIYKKKVIYTLLAVIIAIFVGMLLMYSFFNKTGSANNLM